MFCPCSPSRKVTVTTTSASPDCQEGGRRAARLGASGKRRNRRRRWSSRSPRTRCVYHCRILLFLLNRLQGPVCLRQGIQEEGTHARARAALVRHKHCDIDGDRRRKIFSAYHHHHHCLHHQVPFSLFHHHHRCSCRYRHLRRPFYAQPRRSKHHRSCTYAPKLSGPGRRSFFGWAGDAGSIGA